MGYKCKICGINDVEHMGDICELCAVGQDPYAISMMKQTQKASGEAVVDETNSSSYASGSGRSRKILINGGSAVVNTDPYGNDITVQNQDDSVQVYQAGQIPDIKTGNISQTSTVQGSQAASAKGNQPIVSGISKNISVDTQKKAFLTKWFRALFTGIPFTLGNEVTMFQVFPDYSGTALNAMGYACDQVIVYGKLNAGAVSENNSIEVYGHRDSNNNVVAKTIKNTASGTTITPDGMISPILVWIITLMMAALIAGVCMSLGVEGIVWVIVLIICFMNLPLILKIIGVIFGFIFSVLRK